MRLSVRRWSPAAGVASSGTAVLVHGWTADSRTWWRVAPALADAGFDVVAVDLPGHGATPAPGRPRTVAGWAEDLAETLDAESLPRPIALGVGHSAGAATLVELAAAQPARFASIVLEEPPPGGVGDPEATLAWLAERRAQAVADPAGLRARIAGDNPDWDPGDVEAWIAALQDFDLDGMTPSARAGLGYRAAELLPRLEVPTLLVAGAPARGSLLHAEVRRAMAATLPPGCFVELDAGHSVHRDRFADYVRIVLAWLVRPR